MIWCLQGDAPFTDFLEEPFKSILAFKPQASAVPPAKPSQPPTQENAPFKSKVPGMTSTGRVSFVRLTASLQSRSCILLPPSALPAAFGASVLDSITRQTYCMDVLHGHNLFALVKMCCVLRMSSLWPGLPERCGSKRQNRQCHVIRSFHGTDRPHRGTLITSHK